MMCNDTFKKFLRNLLSIEIWFTKVLSLTVRKTLIVEVLVKLRPFAESPKYKCAIK